MQLLSPVLRGKNGEHQKDLPKNVMDALLNGTDEKLDIHYENRDKTGYFDYNSAS